MTQAEQKKLSRKSYMKFMRKIKAVTVFAALTAFFFGLLTTRDIVNIPYFHIENYLPEHLPPLSDKLWQDSIKGFLLANVSAFLTYFIPSWIAAFALYNRFIQDDDDNEIYKRGAQKAKPEELKKLIEEDMKAKGDKPYFWFGKQLIPIPSKEVPRNFLFLGKVGSGKTQAIFNEIFGAYNPKGRKLKPGIVDYKQTMIIYDRKPDFTQLLFREGQDFLFDPRDKRALKWNIFDDILDYEKLQEQKQGEHFEPYQLINENMLDFVCKILSPVEQGSKDSHFAEQVQGVMKAILIKIACMPNPSNKLLIDFIQAAGEGMLLRNSLLIDKNVQRFGLSGVVSKSLTASASTGSIDNQGSSVLATANKPFKNLCRREFYYKEGNFSVREFINTIDEKPDRRLFIVNTKEMAGAFNTYFTLFVSLFFKLGTTLSQPSNRRIFMLFDEIQSLGSDGNHAIGQNVIEELGNFLAESRSYGYSCTVATQSLPQLEKLIKKEGLRELFQHLSTKVILQYNEPDGSEWLSKYFGEQEVERLKESYSQTGKIVDMTQDRLQESDEEKLKRVVLPAEFNSLKPLEAFVVIGEHPVSKIQFQYRQPPTLTTNLIKRELPFFDQDTIERMRHFYQRQSKEEQVKEALRAKAEAKELTQKLAAEQMGK